MDKLLTIAIPTYNRANRLEKSLSDLLEQIVRSENQQLLSVFISNNGSTDTTAEIIDKHSEFFKQNSISFISHAFSENRGFDANVLNCYRNCDSEYIWFLSDDDNLIDVAINSVIDDIHIHAPSVLYYNFDQDPYNLKNPYIKENRLYNNVDVNNIQSILKIIMWPKLTSLVIRKIDGLAGEKVEAYNFDFMHIALAIQTGLDYGRVFHSDKFIARPDDDYLDHIDFLPFIGNNLKKTVYLILDQNDKAGIYRHIKLETVDPLTSSMNTLGSYYRGNFVLTTELRSKLYSTMINELKNLKITNIKMVVLISILKLFISYAYNIGHMVLTGKSATRLRMIKKNI